MDTKTIEAIKKAAAGIEWGSIQVLIQNGKPVTIEKKETIKIDKDQD